VSQDDAQHGDPRPGYGPPPGSTPPAYGSPPAYGPPPGYGSPPAYGPPPGQAPHPGYGPPPGYAPPPWAWRRPTNPLAILSLVLAFVFAPAGLVLGIIARRQIKQTQEDGDGLALAGIIVGGIATGLYAALIVLYIALIASVTSGT